MKKKILIVLIMVAASIFIVADTDCSALNVYESKAMGFKLYLPSLLSVDSQYEPYFAHFTYLPGRFEAKISVEYSPYKDVDGYISQYMYKYLLDKEYQKANNIVVYKDKQEKIGNYNARVVEFERKSDVPSVLGNQYLHVFYKLNNQKFIVFRFRADALMYYRKYIADILFTFRTIQSDSSAPTASQQFELNIPDNWTAETKALYDSISSGSDIQWGYYYPPSLKDHFTRIESIEETIDYEFKTILRYMYFGDDFPTIYMNQVYSKGKNVELTLQLINYDPKNKRNNSFDILDGKYDDEIRKLARSARDFGHPFYFRLNNEMNTTWTPYSGIAMMCDPDIFVEIWRRIYSIFEEEGVNNAIWIFNPNDRDYPPCKWNKHAAYFPGGDYVQMIGLTGYNTGDYYKSVTGEKWRSFSEIYGPLNKDYLKFYKNFPWILGEFASSSVGGNKGLWIREMFKDIKNYPNIKAAVWWGYADFDYRPATKGTPARRYWLDEKPEYLTEFKKGLKMK